MNSHPEQTARLAHAAQRADVPPFRVMDVLSAAARRQETHGDVVSLAAGQPSNPAPEPVRAAAKRAIDEQNLGYTEQLGIPPLRQGIAEHYRRNYGLSVAAEDVVVTTGSSGAFLLAFLAAFDAGDRVALPRPGYPAYRNILSALGCEVVDLPCGEDAGYVPTPDMVDAAGDVAGVVLASPANPTGTVLRPDQLATLAAHCERRGIRLVSDEIYHGVSFEAEPDCAWRTSRAAIVVNSFSKYFAMTGWRIGWMLVPEQLHRAVDRLAGNFTICPPVHSQHGAVAAFTAESYAEANQHVARYRSNRDLLLDGLRGLGFERFAPADGAFYAWLDVSSLADDSFALCRRWLDEIGLAVVPGIDFDPVEGHRYVRLSFAGAADAVHQGLERLQRWLANR